MSTILEIGTIISIVSFAWYGTSCFLSKRAIAEFEHYRLPHLRQLTGTLQITGGIGLLAGHFYRPLLLFSAGGLAAMMALAFFTRIRIRDPWYQALPSLMLCLINIFIFAVAR